MRVFKSGLILIAIMLVSIGGVAQKDINKLDENGKKHGLWKGLYPESQRVKYEGTFDHGKETGIFTFYDDTKAHTVVATRDFSKGNGAYTIFYDPQKNVVSEGNVLDKKYDGQWKYYHKASKTVMTIENYVDGKLHGVRSVYYPDGTLAEEAHYKEGLRDGPYKKYSLKGNVYEDVTYKKGEIDGPATYNDSDGKVISKGIYKNGLKNGIWEFYENGKLVKKEKHPVVKKFKKKNEKKQS